MVATVEYNLECCIFGVSQVYDVSAMNMNTEYSLFWTLTQQIDLGIKTINCSLILGYSIYMDLVCLVN